MELLYIICVLTWVLGSFIIEGFVSPKESINEAFGFIRTPKVIYRNTKMNIFGCTFLWLLLRAASPLATIWLFVHWVLHVGRREENDNSKPI